MRSLLKFVSTAAAAALSLAAFAANANADSRMFVAYLYGGNEVPGPGDADAFGIATVTFFASNKMCYSIILHNADAANAAHIHTGAAGVPGGPVVTLSVSTALPTRVSKCILVAPATVTAILANPQNFYVNVHTVNFSGGAARGQLQ